MMEHRPARIPVFSIAPSFPGVRGASKRRKCGLQAPKTNGKKPQRTENQLQVMTSTAPQYIHPTPFHPPEPVPPQMTIRFPMPNHRLDGLPTPEALPQSPGHNAPPLPGQVHRSLSLAIPPVAAVDEPLVDRPPSGTEPGPALASGIVRHRDSLPAIPLRIKPLRRVVAMLALTPNSYRRWALPLLIHSTSGACRLYKFVPALLLLRQQPPGHRQFVRKHRLKIRSSSGFSLHVPNYPAQIRPQASDLTVPAAHRQPGSPATRSRACGPLRA